MIKIEQNMGKSRLMIEGADPKFFIAAELDERVGCLRRLFMSLNHKLFDVQVGAVTKQVWVNKNSLSKRWGPTIAQIEKENELAFLLPAVYERIERIKGRLNLGMLELSDKEREIQESLEVLSQKEPFDKVHVENSAKVLALLSLDAQVRSKDLKVPKTHMLGFPGGIHLNQDGKIYLCLKGERVGKGSYKVVKLCVDLRSHEFLARCTLNGKEDGTKEAGTKEADALEKFQGEGVAKIHSKACYVNKKRMVKFSMFMALYNKNLYEIVYGFRLKKETREKIAHQLLTAPEPILIKSFSRFLGSFEPTFRLQMVGGNILCDMAPTI